jgi:hypothetical protein
MIYFRKAKKVAAVPVQFVGDLRESAAKLKTVSIPTALAMTGLMLLFGDVGVALADIPIGPGPTNYTEQPQPPPGTCHYRTAANGETLPDPNCTPGAISPKVTQDTLATTICRTGYTKSIRPPASITEIEKRENAAAYGYTGSLKDVEYDHLVPLELGGDPNDPRNLWIEPGASPNPKDGVESRLHELVCEGRVPLAAAQEAIATDWTTALDTVR